MVATLLHERSGRTGELVVVHCGSVPDALFEAELFGYKKGAFTGAECDRDGLLKQASGGTLFLDEVGELPLMHQVKLLRILSERRYRAVGATREASIETRVIAATNRDVCGMLITGRWRRDFWARICEHEIKVPPFRERVEDVIALARQLAQQRQSGSGFVREVAAAAKSLCGEENAWACGARDIRNLVVRADVDGVAFAMATMKRAWAMVTPTRESRGRPVRYADPPPRHGPGNPSSMSGDLQASCPPTPYVPALSSPHEDLAKLIQERLRSIGAGSIRAAKPRASIALAPLLARSAVLGRHEIQGAIGPCDARTLAANINKLCEAKLLQAFTGVYDRYQLTPGVQLRFLLQKNASSTTPTPGNRDRGLAGEWALLNPATVWTVRAGDRICVETMTCSDMLVNVALISHQPDSYAFDWLHVERRTQAGLPARFVLEFDAVASFEHILTHVTWPARRGGRASIAEVEHSIPAATQLTRARQDALTRLGKPGFTYDIFLHHR